MWGYFISVLSLVGVVCFSACLFLSDSLSFFWLFLELGTLSLVPSFFLVSHDKVLQGLFSYLVVSSISSSFLVCGFLFEDLLFMCLLGMCMKFGMFPFFGWVYKVFDGSNWLVIWGISSFLKSPFFLFSYFMSVGGLEIMSILCGFSFIFLGLVFWLYTHSWVHCWCHMMLSSSVSLVAMSLALSFSDVIYLFLVYVVWGTCVIFFLGGLESGVFSISGVGSLFCFTGLLVSYPLSVSMFYKLVMGFFMYSCSFVIFLLWVVYSVSEQFYLLKFVMGLGEPRWSWGASSLI